jgi:hypothetical protein
MEVGTFLVPVIINDVYGYAIIDTGSPYTMIDSTKFEHEIFRTTTYSNYHITDVKGTRRSLNTLKLDKFMIDKYSINQHLTVPFMKMESRDFKTREKNIILLGLIGLEILISHNAIIDFGNHKLYLRI